MLRKVQGKGFSTKTSRKNRKLKQTTKSTRPQAMRSGFILRFLRDYFINSSLHGLRYIAQDGRHWTERCTWIVLCSMAVVGALFTSSNIWNRYQTSPTMTVLQSTSFPIENLPFPAITICNKFRTRWDMALRYQEKYLLGADEMMIDSFRRLASGLSVMDFGDFDVYGKSFENITEDSQRLVGIDITNLTLELMSTCKEFFVGKCWWRNADYDCCTLFELQRTEYGFCYSFNSDTSEARRPRRGSRQKKCSPDVPNCQKEDKRPRRTTTSGMWSGLRVTVNTFLEHIPKLARNESSPGLIVFVTSPYDFPVLGTDVSAGSTAQVSLSAQVTYTTAQVRSLPPERRGCVYENEAESLGLHKYRHENCIADCHRASTLQYCNCTPFFYPNEDNLPVCDTIGFMCLIEYNDVFNYQKPNEDNPYFDDKQDGMMCSCAADCNRMEYTSEFYVTPGNVDTKEDHVLLDVHFKQPTVVLYRTDVVFGWLDLTVSLGGIAGLFIGFSLLSAAELVYYVTFRLHGQWRAERRNRIPPQTKAQKPSNYQNALRSRKLEYMETSVRKLQRTLPQPYY